MVLAPPPPIFVTPPMLPTWLLPGATPNCEPMGAKMGLPGAELDLSMLEYNPTWAVEVMMELLMLDMLTLEEMAATDTPDEELELQDPGAVGNRGPPEGEILYPGAL